jgi:NAD-dependent SIR2 family protein deacetylase
MVGKYNYNMKIDDVAQYCEENKGKIVVYTGAGISTAASIPDYRGPQVLLSFLLFIPRALGH